MIRRFSLWAVAGLLVVMGVVPTWSNHGPNHPDRSWSMVYHQEVFTVEQALLAGYVQASECEPDMGYHYLKPAELEAWFQGKAGGGQILLYDDTHFLVGVEYLFTAPSLDAPPVLGMNGPMEGHAPGMPVHYDQHIYFAAPQCDEPQG